MKSLEDRVLNALDFIPISKYYQYLQTLPEETVFEVVDQLNRKYPTSDSRSRYKINIFVAQTIRAAESFRKEKPAYTNREEKMLRVSARLILRQLDMGYGSNFSRKNVLSPCLKLFDLGDCLNHDKQLFSDLIRACGKFYRMSEIRWGLNNINRLVTDKNKRQFVRNLLCLGYIDYNGAEKAFTALENDTVLSKLHMQTPGDEIIDSFKKALEAVNSLNRESINRALAVFNSVCNYLGYEAAKAIVLEVRPDLAGQFLDDSGKTFGKKAE